MRRMVGATILVLALGGPKIVAWMSLRHAAPPADSTPGVFPPEQAGGRDPSGRTSARALAAPAHTRAASIPLSFQDDPLRFLNSAPADSLELLPGVGPVLATRLIDARRERGSFRSWDDVDRVRGIGPKTIERLKVLAIRR